MSPDDEPLEPTPNELSDEKLYPLWSTEQIFEGEIDASFTDITDLLHIYICQLNKNIETVREQRRKQDDGEEMDLTNIVKLSLFTMTKDHNRAWVSIIRDDELTRDEYHRIILPEHIIGTVFDASGADVPSKPALVVIYERCDQNLTSHPYTAISNQFWDGFVMKLKTAFTFIMVDWIGNSSHHKSSLQVSKTTVNTQIRFQVFKKIKDAHPSWTQERVAQEANDLREIDIHATSETVRNAYRSVGATWPRGDRVR